MKTELKYMDKVKIKGFYETKFPNGAYVFEETMFGLWVGKFRSSHLSFLFGKYELVSKGDVAQDEDWRESCKKESLQNVEGK